MEVIRVTVSIRVRLLSSFVLEMSLEINVIVNVQFIVRSVSIPESIRRQIEANLPENIQFCDHQAGGHHRAQGRSIGLLHDLSTSHVLKPVSDKAISQIEISFYEELADSERRGEMWPRFIPRYHGTRLLNVSGADRLFIELDDLTLGIHRPNTLDAKLGGCEKAGDSRERIQRRRAQYPHYDELGFRLDGCQIYDHSKGEYRRLGTKITNRTINNIRTTIRSFLDFEHSPANAEFIVRNAVPELEALERWMSTQPRRFYSSSVLIVYGLESDLRNEDSLSSAPIVCRIRLVDFVHTSKIHHDYDDRVKFECIKGVRELRKFLIECLNAEKLEE